MTSPIELELISSNTEAAWHARAVNGSPQVRERIHEGFLDRIAVTDDCTVVEGWAWNSGRPNEPVQIEVLLNGKPIAKEEAGQFRYDLLAAGKGNGHHAFGAVIASVIDPEALPGIEVRVAETEIRLDKGECKVSIRGVEQPQISRSGPKADAPAVTVKATDGAARNGTGGRTAGRSASHTDDRAAPAIQGAIQGEVRCTNGHIIEGWLANRQRPGTAPAVEVWIDGVLYWAGECRRLPRPKDNRDKQNNQNSQSSPDQAAADPALRGFKVDLPAPAEGCERQRIEVFVAGTRDHVPGSPIVVFAAQRHEGSVDRIEIAGGKTAVHGWARTLSRPYDPVEVEVFLHGDRLAATVADKFRHDLANAGKGLGHHAFTAIVPTAVAEADLPALRVKLAGTGFEIPRSIRCRIEIAQPGPAGADAPHAVRLRPAQEADVIQGSLDKANVHQVTGWARNMQAPESPVLLDLMIDNHYFMSKWTSAHRAEVAKKFGDEGFYGFTFELPPNLFQGGILSFSVVPRTGVSQIKNNPRKVGPSPNAIALDTHRRPAGLPKTLYYRAQRPEAAGIRPQAAVRPSIALIVLNRNGQDLLEPFFDSFATYNTYPNYRIIIVDHGSTDDSLAVCRKWAERLNVDIYARGQNYSFSASNNYGAKATDSDYVAFVNNDIVFCQDVLPDLVDLMQRDPEVGLVGLKLLDIPADNTSVSPPAIQHLSIHFMTDHREQWIFPFESRYVGAFSGLYTTPCHVPAVTGAFFACRRTEFLAIGGFEEPVAQSRPAVAEVSFRHGFVG